MKLPVLVVFLLWLTAAAAHDGDDGSTKMLFPSSTLRLNDNYTMPMVGLGVALSGEETYQAVRWALEAGYRLVDTAAEESYGNEGSVGKAIHDAGIGRQDVFVTTKLWDDDHGFYETIDAFEESLEELNLPYIDLYLMHSPYGGGLLETWDAMIYLQSQGLVKSIGVSNFGIQHLKAIMMDGRPLPAVNQMEMHPLIYKHRAPLLEFCRKQNIQVQAYGSVVFGSKWLQAERLIHMTKRYNKTPAQVLLRWALQHDILVIPKSVRQARIQENIDLFDFELDPEDMHMLDNWGDDIDQPESRLLYMEEWNWNPIDEAPVHAGDSHYWPDFYNVEEHDGDNDHEDDDEYEDGDEDEL